MVVVEGEGALCSRSQNAAPRAPPPPLPIGVPHNCDIQPLFFATTVVHCSFTQGPHAHTLTCSGDPLTTAFKRATSAFGTFWLLTTLVPIA